MKYKSPVYNVIAVPIEKVRPNNYNPNKVAPPEMRLLYESIKEQGLLPVSVIEKPIDKRMASTVRHNRARGTHDVDLMSNIVKELHEFGRSDAWISKHLGMDRDEILRLKQITGLAALFRDIKFGEAWRPVEEETEKESII